MTKQNLALDMDGTLANTYDTAFKLMLGDDTEYSRDDIETWQWGLNEFGEARFLSSLWHSWTLRRDDIEPMEPGLAETTAALAEHYEIDVLTANPDHFGIYDSKKQWLDDRGITYNELRICPAEQSKGQYFEYDVFVDDKPTLPERTGNGRKVFLRDAPYNQDAGGDYTRINSIEEVLELTIIQ